jgi:hypothetical protein
MPRIQPLQNLISNSGFGVCSLSSVCERVSGAAPVTDGANAALVNNLISNGGFDSATTGWTATNSTLVSEAGGKTGNGLKVTTTNNYGYAYQQITGLTVGKLYYVSGYLKNGTSGVMYFRVGTAITVGDMWNADDVIPSSFTQYSGYFEATTTSVYITLMGSGNAISYYFDSICLYEFVPGYVAGNALTFDSWSASGIATFQTFREHQGTNTKAGSFYSAKCINTSGASRNLRWPNDTKQTQLEFIERFRGRTMAFGCWIKTTTASSARLSFYDGSTFVYSSYHTGSGNWEWLEVTSIISTSLTSFGARVYFDLNCTAYISQPMLVFGSYIGKGNYSPIINELVHFDSPCLSTKLFAQTLSSVSYTTMNIEADSKGAIPKGIKGFYSLISCKDSASSGALCMIGFSGNGSNHEGVGSCEGLDNNRTARCSGLTNCTPSGDFLYIIYATGTNTLTAYVSYYGVIL